VEVCLGQSLNPCMMASGSILWLVFLLGQVFILRCLSSTLVWTSIGRLLMSAAPWRTCQAKGLVVHSLLIRDWSGSIVNMDHFACEKWAWCCFNTNFSSSGGHRWCPFEELRRVGCSWYVHMGQSSCLSGFGDALD